VKNKVLYISECHIYGGSERSIINIMNFISQNPDFEVYFMYRYYKIYQEGVDRDISTSVIRIPVRLFSYFSLSFNLGKKIKNQLLYKLVKLPFWIIKKIGIYDLYNYLLFRIHIGKIRPNIIHINNGGYPGSSVCMNAVFAAKHYGLSRIIFHINNPAAKRKNKFQKILDIKINKYVDLFISGSRQTIDSLEHFRGFSSEKLMQIYNTIEHPRIDKSNKEIRKQYGIENGAFVITEAAFLSQRKGQIFLLKALLKIKNNLPELYQNIFVFLVGDGEDYQFLSNYCIDNGLNNVRFTGYVPNYADYINASDLFILPSIGYEDMPLVILAAMAMQKAIISTRVAGIIEEIESGISGVLLNVEELDSLDQYIVRLLNDKELRVFYAENAKKRYDDMFKREKICRQFELVYTKYMDYKK